MLKAKCWKPYQFLAGKVKFRVRTLQPVWGVMWYSMSHTAPVWCLVASSSFWFSVASRGLAQPCGECLPFQFSCWDPRDSGGICKTEKKDLIDYPPQRPGTAFTIELLLGFGDKGYLYTLENTGWVTMRKVTIVYFKWNLVSLFLPIVGPSESSILEPWELFGTCVLEFGHANSPSSVAMPCLPISESLLPMLMPFRTFARKRHKGRD